MYIFDHRVMEAIRRVHGVGKGKLPCSPDRDVIEVRRGFLARFNQTNANHILPYLGFDSEEWKIRERLARVSIQIGLFSHPLELKIVEVLPKELMPELDAIARVPKQSVIPMRRTLRLTVKAMSA
jgi:hypothetical protein